MSVLDNHTGKGRTVKCSPALFIWSILGLSVSCKKDDVIASSDKCVGGWQRKHG